MVDDEDLPLSYFFYVVAVIAVIAILIIGVVVFWMR